VQCEEEKLRFEYQYKIVSGLKKIWVSPEITKRKTVTSLGCKKCSLSIHYIFIQALDSFSANLIETND